MHRTTFVCIVRILVIRVKGLSMRVLLAFQDMTSMNRHVSPPAQVVLILTFRSIVSIALPTAHRVCLKLFV